MKYQIDHDLHIHSLLSRCSRCREQTAERILQYAEENHLSTVCMTNHFWDSAIPEPNDWYWAQDYAHLAQAKPLPQSENVRFLFGCETELRQDLVLGISPEKYDLFDFIIIPTTHMHMPGFTVPEVMTLEDRAKAYVERLDAVLSMDLPFHKIGLAHLGCRLMAKNEDISKVLGLIPHSEYERLFAKAAKLGVGIELNATDFRPGRAETEMAAILRLFGIAKAQGCKFYLGCDAHKPAAFENSCEIFETAINALDLTEDDKFHPAI